MRRDVTPAISGLRVFARLDSALHACMGITRGAGSWSRQTGPAVNGTTFIEFGTAVNTARFDYDAASGRPMLVIEPTRRNLMTATKITDANSDGLPDNWIANGGVAGVDYMTYVGGIAGLKHLRLEDTAVAQRGPRTLDATNALTSYACSVWVRRPATTAVAGNLYTIHTNPGFGTVALPNGPYDWRRIQKVETTVGGGLTMYLLETSDDPEGVVWLDLPQVEDNSGSVTYATSVIPTSGGVGATRAAELVELDPSVEGRYHGRQGFLWRPDYDSTTALPAVAVLKRWANGYRLIYDPADDKLKIVVAGVNRASSAALSFSARGSKYRLEIEYGAAGTRLSVDGTPYVDSTAWGDPGVLSPCLGSDAASANCEASGYADYFSAV